MVHITPCEFRALQLAATGMVIKDIAAKLNVSPNTVDCHLLNLRGKVGLHTTVALVLAAVKAGILPMASLPDFEWNVAISQEPPPEIRPIPKAS